jgi:putative hydrolase of the HAD superfamily
MHTVKVIIFDWGDTLMRDYGYEGSMVYWPKISLIPGVEKCLKELFENYIICVASNAGDSDAELLGMALEKMEIKKYFKKLYTSKELGCEKPDLNFFKMIATDLRVRPDECVMIGNSYTNDVFPAKKFGMKAIFFDEHDKGQLGMADFKINSMSELMDVLKKI